MPRMAGESVCSTVWRIRLNPSARTVRFWSSAYPIGLRIRVTFNLPLEDADLGMFLPLPERPQFSRVFSPVSCLFAHLLQIIEAGQGGPGDVKNVRASQGLSEDVPHTGGLQHRSHPAAGDHTRAGRGRLEQYLSTAETRHHFVGDGRTLEGDRLHRLAGLLRRLVDGIRHAPRLPRPQADVAPVVADDDRYAKGKAPPALDDLGDPGDVDDPLVQLFPLFTSLSKASSHFITLRLPSDGVSEPPQSQSRLTSSDRNTRPTPVLRRRSHVPAPRIRGRLPWRLPPMPEHARDSDSRRDRTRPGERPSPAPAWRWLPRRAWLARPWSGR